MATFTFFHNPMSRAAIAHWALEEAGADYDTVLVDWTDKPQALLDANPMGKIPTLIHHHGDHDHVVTEAAAICHYLAETHPDADLLPGDHKKADYFRWLFFASGPLEAAITAKAMGWEVPEDRRATAGFGSYDLAVDALDSWLETHDFVCGSRFTMADVYVGAQVDWGLEFGTLPERDAFKAYRARFYDRDAFKRARADDEKLMAEMQK